MLENRIFLDANPLAAVDGGDAVDTQDVHLEAADPNDSLAVDDVHDGQSPEVPFDTPEVAEGDGVADPQDTVAEGAEDGVATEDLALTVEDPDQTADAEAASAENGGTSSGDLLQSGDQQDSPSADTSQYQDTDNDGDVTDATAAPEEASAQDAGVVPDVSLETSADTADADASTEILQETDGTQSDPTATLTDQHATDTTGEEAFAGSEAQDLDAVEAQDAADSPSDADQGELTVAETTDGAQEGDGDFLGEPLLTDADSQNTGLETEALDPMIGEDFSFTYSFENTLSQTGYGPYVDIYFPTSGLQGDHPDPQPPGSDIYDGIKFVQAEYQGTPVTAVEQTFDVTGQLEHPFARDSSGNPVIVNGQEGDTYVSLQLPFGSYTPQQPAADITITAHMSNLAEVDKPLDVTTSSGFMFGTDPLDNPTSDPSLPNQTATDTSWLPEVLRYQKNYPGAEGETATGPNYPRSYEIAVDVAAGRTVENIQIIDTVPDNIVFLGNVTGGTVVQVPDASNGNTLIVEVGDITGIAGTDATVTFDFYVGDILSGCDTSEEVVNNMHLEARWHPLDNRDPVLDPLVVDREVDDNGNISNGADEIFEARPLTVQKTASDENGDVYKPGDIVRYELQFQVSDYHALGNIEIQDLMSDGMAFYQDATHQPSFTIQDQYGNYSGDFTVGGDMDVVPRPDLGDKTEIDFDVSQAIIAAGDHLGDGVLEGGRSNGTTGGAAMGTIVYYGQIQEHYISPDVPVNQGDTLDNAVTVNADRYEYTGGVLDAAPSCTMTGVDGSTAAVEMPVGGVDKTLFAVDGVPVGSAPVHVAPESEVTYRLSYRLPNSDFYDLVMEDYLPLPIFDASDPDHDPSTPNTWVTHFTAGDINATAPAVGHVKFGPGETFFPYSGLAPAVSTDGSQNALIFDWDDHYDAAHQSTTVDLLFTVKVSTEPFTDGLFLTNQVQATEDGNSTSTTTSDIVQIVLDEPQLEITKGVIATDNANGNFTGSVGPVAFSAPDSPGFRGDADITESGLDATPIDADLTGIDAGDLVSFAIVVRNVGHYGAYDIHIDDDLPTGFEIPVTGEGLNLSVTNGSTTSSVTYSGDLFGAGLDIAIPLTGNDDARDQSDNILIITYDLFSQDTVQPLQDLENTGEVTHYAAASGGTNFVPEGIEDPALVTVSEPHIDKDFNPIYAGNTSYTNQPHTTDPDVAIGELVSYRAVITVPEGTTHTVTLSDTMDAGLAIVDIDSIAADSDLTTSIAGGWAGVLANARSGLSSPGRTFSIDFGNIINSNSDNDVDETITVTYRVVTLNTSGNQGSPVTRLNNNARWSWVEDAGGVATTHSVNDQAPNVIVREPDMAVTKEVQEDDGSWVNNATGLDQGDNVSYRITIHHDGASIDGFDAHFEDTLPDQIDWSGVDQNDWTVDGTPPDSWSYNTVSHLLVADWSTLGSGESTVFTVTGGLLTSTLAGQTITNTGDLTWTSLPGDVTTPQSAHNSLSTERTGDTTDPGGTANDYTDSDGAAITVTGAIDKVDDGNRTIGETHTYDITVSLPEGHTDNLVVTDQLPTGLVVDDPAADIRYDYASTGFNGSVETPNPVPLISGNTIRMDFGDVDVVSGPGTQDNAFLIHLTVRVDNIYDNHDGVGLTNHASMTYGTTPVTIDDPTDPVVTIIEPQITTTKAVEDASGDQSVEALGEILTYTVRFENTGHSTAFEVDALDIMAPGTGFVGLDAVTYHDTSASSDTDITGSSFGTDNRDGTLSFGSTNGDSWDIAVDDYVEIVYSAQVLGAWFVPGSHENTIDADWTGLDGDNPHERIYDDGLTPPGSPVDGIQDEDTATYIVPDGSASLGDLVWFDANADGGKDPSEPGIRNVTVTAEVAFNGTTLFSETTTTDGNGLYRFDDLQGATYQVTVDAATLPPGMYPTYDLDGVATPHTATVPLGMHQDRTDVDFGYDGLDNGEIGDYIWYDANRDGVQDASEIGIAGAVVRLEGDINSNGNYDYVTYASTDADGGYIFTNLPGVDYIITVMSLPSGFDTQTFYPNGSAVDDTGYYALAADESYREMDFGYVGPGRIGDFVWDDLNADGQADPGEPGMDGIAVTLAGDLDGDGNPDFTLQTTTSGGGSYEFDGLPEADYTVRIDPGSLPPRYIPSGDPDGTLDNSSRLALAAGAMDNLDQDFGYTKTGSIGDTIWYDANANRVQDGVEPGLAGVRVTLVGDVDLDGTPDTLTTTTDGSGHYRFDTLPLGGYTVTVDSASLPGGMRPTYDADGIATPHTAAVSLAYGENNTATDFGYTGTGFIGDTVWNDLNRNGVQEAGEPGIAGVAVTLTGDFDRDGSVDYRAGMATDDSGRYLFANLPAGSYTLTLDPASLPPEMVQTYDPDGIPDGFTRLALRGGEHNLDQDFGYARPPQPPQPPVVPPVEPPQPPVTPPEPSPPPFAFDVLYMPGEPTGIQRLLETLWYAPQQPQVFAKPLIPAAPVYTGSAEPGTTLRLDIYDAMGNRIGSQTVMADAGGNWLAGFSGTLMYDEPHHVDIQQTLSSYNTASGAGYNLRTYFSPAPESKPFFYSGISEAGVFTNTASVALDAMHNFNHNPLRIDWDRFYGYEFLVSSVNPSQSGC